MKFESTAEEVSWFERMIGIQLELAREHLVTAKVLRERMKELETTGR